MDSYRKLFDNVLIFAMGNLGSKIISFILVPLYTYYLSQTEYGTIDMVQTTVMMLLPFISGSTHEAVLRFSIDSNSVSRNSILSNSFVISFFGYFLLILVFPIFYVFNIQLEVISYLYILILMQMINQIFSQYSRGIGRAKVFAFNGIITALSSSILSIFFIVKLGLGINGYFSAYILAYVISTIYLVLKTKPLLSFNKDTISKKKIKKILTYSLPLIPNSLMWWFINSSSRYVINISIGIAANGLFAVASKIPGLLNIVTQIFSQAWQLSAFEQFEKNKENEFYDNIFYFYSTALFIFSSVVIIFCKFTFLLLFADDYYSAWEPVPFLMIGSCFSSLSGFIGVAYTASKETKGLFKTSVYGGLGSMALNLLIIPNFGIIGAGISSMISFFFMFLIRIKDTKDIFKLKVNWYKFFSTLFLIVLQIAILFISDDLVSEFIINGFIFLILLFLNRKIFTVLNFIKK